MTLDESIKYFKEISREQFNISVYIANKMKSDIALSIVEEYRKCANENRRIAEWLRDYKWLLEKVEKEEKE